ncbi:MAG: YgaP family membrane protein [Sulfobacillus sp.]
MKNVPRWERGLRLAGGVAVIVSAFWTLGGIAREVLIALGAGLALSGVLGFCPMCALAGRRLKPQGNHKDP